VKKEGLLFEWLNNNGKHLSKVVIGNSYTV